MCEESLPRVLCIFEWSKYESGMGMLTRQLQSNACRAFVRAHLQNRGLTQNSFAQSSWRSCKAQAHSRNIHSIEPFWKSSQLRTLDHLASTDKEKGGICKAMEERRLALSTLSVSRIHRQGEAICERPLHSTPLISPRGVRTLKASAMASSGMEQASASGNKPVHSWKGKVRSYFSDRTHYLLLIVE